MPANSNPISPLTPAESWNPTPLVSANTALDGTGTVGTIIIAGVNGSKVPRVRVVHRGTNILTVIRIFENNGLTNATPANNNLVAEAAVPANALSQTAASLFFDILLNLILKPGYKLLYTIGTGVAAGHSVGVPDAGDY